ncbi:hypothetical protein BaRGS_00021593 [Batillaria attramentaria]|uniref:Uncharacterized protein n=1 Tax=Batillaria attramentaria TaxID=370345 RepID=A0ABD0KJD6_9CAEN
MRRGIFGTVAQSVSPHVAMVTCRDPQPAGNRGDVCGKQAVNSAAVRSLHAGQTCMSQGLSCRGASSALCLFRSPPLSGTQVCARSIWLTYPFSERAPTPPV